MKKTGASLQGVNGFRQTLFEKWIFRSIVRHDSGAKVASDSGA